MSDARRDAHESDVDLILRLDAQFIKAAECIRRGTTHVLRSLGLTDGHAMMVDQLIRADAPMQLEELARRLELGEAAVRGGVDTLESAGLVERLPHPTELDSTCIHPTRAGHEFLQRLHRAREESAEVVYGRLTDEQLDRLFVLLSVMADCQPQGSAD